MMRVDSVVNRGDVALPAWMFVVLLKAAAAAAAAAAASVLGLRSIEIETEVWLQSNENSGHLND
jgi:hypothetical protein